MLSSTFRTAAPSGLTGFCVSGDVPDVHPTSASEKNIPRTKTLIIKLLLLVVRAERALDHLLRSLVAAQVPVLGNPEQNRHDDLGLVRRRVADEPGLLHVERLARRERARLAGNALALAEALRS